VYRYEFLVEDAVLETCYVGLKMEATVMKFNVGEISFLDCVLLVYPSFYTWTRNERIRDFVPAGPPKEWMKRQNESHLNGGGDGADGEGENGEDVTADRTPMNVDGDGTKALEEPEYLSLDGVE
jgi:hypothetical protein